MNELSDKANKKYTKNYLQLAYDQLTIAKFNINNSFIYTEGEQLTYNKELLYELSVIIAKIETQIKYVF